jgi:hypothetical protein
LFLRDCHDATSPMRSASLAISYWQTLHVNVCLSKSCPRTRCGVRLVKLIRCFLHFGQIRLSVAPKEFGMAMFLVGWE